MCIRDRQNTGDTAETEQKAWVYATETVNIRQEANEQSAVLASAVKGSELRQLAVTANGWSKVKTGEIVGYIKSEYISCLLYTSYIPVFADRAESGSFSGKTEYGTSAGCGQKRQGSAYPYFLWRTHHIAQCAGCSASFYGNRNTAGTVFGILWR